MLGMMQYVQGQAKIINAVVRARTPLAHQRRDNRRRTEYNAPQQQYGVLLHPFNRSGPPSILGIGFR